MHIGILAVEQIKAGYAADNQTKSKLRKKRTRYVRGAENVGVE